MTHSITEVEHLKDRDEFSGILRDYLRPEVAELHRTYDFTLDLDALVSKTMDNIANYLPPKGALWLVRDDTDKLLATICLRMIRSDVSEVKRLYVRPEARGQSLALTLVAAAIDRSRELGAKRLCIDTGLWQTPAIALYRKMGFEEIPPYPESEIPVEMQQCFVFMQKTLED